MRKMALAVGICGIFTIAGYKVYAKTSDSEGGSDEIAELKKQISSLDERIRSLEKRLDDRTILALTRPRDPNTPDWAIPLVQPRQQLIPRGSVRHEFNGIPFYVVPAKNARR